MSPNLQEIFPRLTTHNVRFIVVGGLAAIAHGSAQVTDDFHLVYSRDLANLQSLATALAASQPYLRGAPPGLPFRLDEATLQAGLNFTLTTTLGDIDLLGEVAGGGRYEDLLPFTVELDAYGVRCRLVALEKLIDLKRAAGRPKDLQAIGELQALMEERRKLDSTKNP